MAAQDVLAPPSWVKVGSKCKWWSESQKTSHPIVVTSIDLAKKRVVVHFEADHRVWKTVPFALIGSNGPLRPSGPDTGDALAPDASKHQKAGPRAAKQEGAGGRDEEDGTATPPWYEQIAVAETRDKAKDEILRQEEEVTAQQERRRAAWETARRKQAEEEALTREVEKRRREEAAEADRLRILKKLQKEREEEQRRQMELQLMELEEAVTARVNAVWRQREAAVRQQLEEEVRLREEESQRLLQERLREEMASRPRVSFGVKTKPEMQKIVIPQPEKASAQPGSGALAQEPALAAPAAAGLPPGDEGDSLDDGRGAAGADGLPLAADGAARGGAAPAPPPPLGEAEAAAVAAPARGHPAEAEAAEEEVHPARQPARTATESYGRRISQIYAMHNPAKLADVPGLLAKYAGCEAEMYDRICKKYGVEPEPAPRLSSRGSSLATPGEGREARRGAHLPAAGYARKAGAPAPPPRPRPPGAVGAQQPVQQSSSSLANAPSSMSLLARFQNLVSPADCDAGDADGDVETHGEVDGTCDTYRRDWGNEGRHASSEWDARHRGAPSHAEEARSDRITVAHSSSYARSSHADVGMSYPGRDSRDGHYGLPSRAESRGGSTARRSPGRIDRRTDRLDDHAAYHCDDGSWQGGDSRTSGSRYSGAPGNRSRSCYRDDNGGSNIAARYGPTSRDGYGGGYDHGRSGSYRDGGSHGSSYGGDGAHVGGGHDRVRSSRSRSRGGYRQDRDHGSSYSGGRGHRRDGRSYGGGY